MPAEVNDEELMSRIRDGDEEAFRHLIERHQDRVYGTVARMMGGAGPEAEEVAQDIFLRVWRSAGTYRPEAKFTTWLMTIVRNLVFTRSGQRARRKAQGATSLAWRRTEWRREGDPWQGRQV